MVSAWRRSIALAVLVVSVLGASPARTQPGGTGGMPALRNPAGSAPLDPAGPAPLNPAGPAPLDPTGPAPLNPTGEPPLEAAGRAPLDPTGSFDDFPEHGAFADLEPFEDGFEDGFESNDTSAWSAVVP